MERRELQDFDCSSEPNRCPRCHCPIREYVPGGRVTTYAPNKCFALISVRATDDSMQGVWASMISGMLPNLYYCGR